MTVNNRTTASALWQQWILLLDMGTLSASQLESHLDQTDLDVISETEILSPQSVATAASED